MGVIGIDGTWYLLSPTVNTVAILPENLAVAYNDTVQRLKPRYIPLVQRGELTPEAAWREHTHVAWQILVTQLHLRYDRIEPQKGA